MATGKNKYRVLVASAGDKIYEYMESLLPAADYELLPKVGDAGQARRLLLERPADLVIINTPLPDEFGMDLAMDLSEGTCGILLLVKQEYYDRACYKTEDKGVFTLVKPNTRQGIYSAVKLLTAVSARLSRMEKKNLSLQEKMADIRIVNRAKWALITNLNMSETDAHYYIERLAMDSSISRREAAERIIRTYDQSL